MGYQGTERREFFRYTHIEPAAFSEISKNDKTISELARAVTRNLSASGMLFTSEYPPRLSSIIIIDVDRRTVRICGEIEERAMIVNNRLLGKVVRLEDNDDGSYDVGVAFITKSEGIPGDILSLLK